MGCSLDTQLMPDTPGMRNPFAKLDPNQMESTSDKPKYAQIHPDQSSYLSAEEQDYQLGQYIIDKFTRIKNQPTPGNTHQSKQKYSQKTYQRKSVLNNISTPKNSHQQSILPNILLEPLITALRIKYRKYKKDTEIKNHYDVNDLKQEIRAIYVGIIKEKLTQANDGKITIDECKIQISQMALEVQILCLKYVMDKAGFKEGIVFYQEMGRFLKQLTGFLKTKYPRSEVLDSAELAKEIKEINATEEYQYDMLKNSGFAFNSTDEVEITKTIKLFLNKIIDELEIMYPKFKELIESSFHNEKNKAIITTNYKIGRKISQNTAKYTKLSTGTIEVRSSEIERVLIKWLEDLSEMILKPREVIIQKNEYKFYNLEKGEAQTIFSKCTQNKCQQLIEDGLINKVQEYTSRQHQKHKQMKRQFNQFNVNLINIFNLVQHSQHQVSKEEMEVIKFSYYNSDFISWIVEQQLIHSIKTLVEVGQQYQQSGAYLDLIKFKCNDLMRCQFFGNRHKIMQIYKEFQRLDKIRALQIIKIKNRFETNMGDAMIFFKLPGSFIICECQLILSNDSKGQNVKKAKNIEAINHFLYELERSPFGVLGQIGVFLKSKAETVSSYCQIIELFRDKNIKECLEEHREPEKIEQQLRPFVCSRCVQFNPKFSNLFKIHECKKCLVTVCNTCLDQKFQITETLLKNELLQKAQRFQAEFRQSEQYKAITIMKGTQKMQQLTNMTQISLQKFYDKKLKEMIDANTFSNIQSPSPISQPSSGQPNLMKGLSDVFKQKRIKMKELFKNNRIKVEQIINYLHKEYQNQLKNDEKVMFVIATWKQRELKFKLYDYNQDENNIVNSYEQLEKYEKHEFIRVSDYDLILEIKSFNKIKISEIRKDLPNDMSPSIFQKGIYLFEGQDKTKMIDTYKKLIATGANDNQNYLVYYEFAPFYLIIDFDHSVKGSKSDGWVEQYLKGVPDLFLFRKNIQLNNESIQNKELICFERLQWVLSIKILNLNQNKISDISKVLQNCVNLQELSIRQNKIRELVFNKKLDNLKYLNAGKNQSIERVRKLHNIINIQDLDLSDNKIQYIIVDDDESPIIEKIDKGIKRGDKQNIEEKENLPKNNEKNLNQPNSSNKNSKNEDSKNQKLANNQIQQKLSQKTKFIFPFLTKLNLTQNKLESILQLSNSEYPSLTQLYLNDNQIYKLPKLHIPKLKKLDVSYNNLYQIDDFVKSQLNQLVELYLNDNKFWRLPALGNLPKLKKVDLCYNNVKKIQEFIKGDYPQLKEFYFTDNKIVTVPKFNTPKIQILHLDSNSIENLNEFIKGVYPDLIELNLDKNKLTELPELNYPLLKRIDFCQNQIKNVSGFAKLSYPNLQQIDLSYNKLTNFPKLETPNLQKIVLEENLIDSIREFAQGDYPKLTAFSISYSTSVNPSANAQKKFFSDQEIIMIENISKPKDSQRQTSQREKLVSQRGGAQNPLQNLLKEISHNSCPSVQDYYKTFLEAQEKVRGKDEVIEAATFKNMGLVFMEEENYQKSIEFYQKSLELTLKTKGQNNIDYTSTLVQLANVYTHCYNFEEALAGYQKALQILEKLTGKDNQNYISTLLRLSALHLRNEQKFLAVQMYEESLKLQEKVKRKDSIQCSEILKKIGQCYSIIGDFTKSLQNYQKCLKIQLKIKGKRTIEVAQTIIRIGSVYYQKGDNSKALQNYEKGVQIQKKVIGEESEEYAINLKSIIDLYTKQNLYYKAVFYSERYLEIIEKNKGQEDEEYISTLTSLAGLHVKIGITEAYLKALNYHERCLKIQETIIQKHEQKGRELYEIKEQHHLQEMKSKFEDPVNHTQKMFQLTDEKQRLQSRQVIESKKQVQVENKTNRSKTEIHSKKDAQEESKIQIAQKTQKNPIELKKNLNPLETLFKFSNEEKQITAQQQHFNEQKRNNHYNMGITYHNIGCIYELLDDHENALKMYERCYEILEYIESDQSENSIVVLDKIGNIYYKKKGEIHNAINSYKLCLETKETVYGQDSNGCIKTLQVLAQLYAKVNNFDEALICMSKCHKLQQQTFGQDHTEVTNSLFKKAEFLVKLQQYTAALETLEKCLKLFEKTKSKQSIEVAQTIQKMAEVYDNQNLNKKAIQFAQKSLALKIKVKNYETVELVSSFTMLSKVHIEEKNLDRGVDNINKAIKIIDANSSIAFIQHPILYFYLGQVKLLAKDSNIKTGIQFFEKSIQIYQKQNPYIFIFLQSNQSQALPSSHKLLHPFYPRMLQKLSDCYELVGEKQKSFQKIKECYQIAKNVKGESHDQTKRLMAKMIRSSGENFVNQIIGNTQSSQRQTSMEIINIEPIGQEKKDSLDRLKKIIMES